MTGKRTKSWRDIDKGKGARTGTRQSREEEQKQERLQHSQAYQDYKKNLEAMFGGGGEAPDALKGALDPTGEKSAKKAALKKTPSRTSKNQPQAKKVIVPKPAKKAAAKKAPAKKAPAKKVAKKAPAKKAAKKAPAKKAPAKKAKKA